MVDALEDTTISEADMNNSLPNVADSMCMRAENKRLNLTHTAATDIISGCVVLPTKR
jgi:hypothetical protein